MRTSLAVIVVAAALAACGSDGPIDLTNPGGLTEGGGRPTGTGGGGGGGGGGGATSRTIRCDYTGSYFCIQVTGSMTDQQETDWSFSCAGDGGSFVSDSCSTTGTVTGHCAWSGDPWNWGVSGNWRGYYGTGGWDAASAAASCAGGGGGWQ